MDELLDLLDEEEDRRTVNEKHRHQPPKKGTGGNDDIDELLDLMDENAHNEASQSPPNIQQAQLVTPPPPPNNRQKKSRREQQPPAKQPKTKSKPVSAGIDDKLGIRMMDRKVSSVDLVDMISINPYHTPATLTAMSLTALARLLIDPPIRIDPATVMGKMNVVTVGVVFGNSGTKISKKGGAFCILDIGNFTSGPCLSVMLFGDVYSKHVRTCVPGKVVAVTNPTLLPIKDGGKSRISVTVNSSNQFHLVAKAMDYAVCKGTTRVKGSDGKWTSSGNCKNWVDKRVCEFCQYHRKQKEKKSKSAAHSVGGSLSQLRAENQMAVASSRFGTMNRGRFAGNGGGGGTTNNSLQAVPMQMKKNLAEQRRSIVVQQQQRQKTNGSNRFLNGGGAAKQIGNGLSRQQQQQQLVGQTGNRLTGVVPRQMKSKSLTNVTNTSNPYSKQRNSVPAPKPKPKPKTGIVGSSSLRGGDGDWFQQASKPRPAGPSRAGSLNRFLAKGSKKRINTDGGGFDGSVQVPKPNRIFAGGQRQMLSDSSRASRLPDRSRSSTTIMESQAEIAKMWKQVKDDKKNGLKEKSKGSSKNSSTSSSSSSSKNSFYDTVGDIDLEKVKNTKSKYAKEAEAEEYAKSRQKVVELEKLEGSKNAKKRQVDDKSLTVEYCCKTCGTCSMYPPKSCIKANHQVKKIRKFAQLQSKEAKRTKLHQKGAADGGLRLGAGNEWARNIKDFHS